MDAGEAFVVAKVEVGFGTVVGDEDLAVFEGRHGAGVDVEVGIKFPQPHRIAARLQQGPEGRRGQTLAKRRHHATRNEHKPCHGVENPREVLLWAAIFRVEIRSITGFDD